MMHKIEIDDEVWQFLKKHAEPFEDTPNSVLRRLLLKPNADKGDTKTNYDNSIEFPQIPIGVPKALQQILEVTFYVLKRGYTREEATHLVAKKRAIAPQTVFDKYTRQLNKTASEFDYLLNHRLEDLKKVLKNKFPSQQTIIDNFFNNLTTKQQ